MTEEKKYRVIVWTRNPVRKIRMADASEADVVDLTKTARSGAMTTLTGTTKAGWFVLIPADNIGYLEFHEK